MGKTALRLPVEQAAPDDIGSRVFLDQSHSGVLVHHRYREIPSPIGRRIFGLTKHLLIPTLATVDAQGQLRRTVISAEQDAIGKLDQ